MNDCLWLRVKDIYFGQQLIVVRGGKGFKDRTTMLPVTQGYGFTGCGLAGGDFDYRFGWGSYSLMGTTPQIPVLVSRRWR